MPWVRIDDAFYDHERWYDADPCEIGAWVLAIAWSNRNLKDGRVPKVVMSRLAVKEETVAGLVARGALDELDDRNWMVHDYLEWQKSASEIRELSKKRAEAGQRGGNATATAKQAASNGRGKSPPQPQPSVTRSTKPSVDFSPTDEHCAYANEHQLNVQGEIDHWVADCEAKGRTYKVLNAGFTTWLHNAVKFRDERARPVPKVEKLVEVQRCKRCANTGNYVKNGEVIPCKVHEYR